MTVSVEDGRGHGVNIWRIAGWGGALGLLLLPLIAMQFTEEVRWGPMDFVFAAVMFGSVGGVLELTVRKTRSTAHRVAVGLALAATFMLIWVNGAVGIIGDEDNPANLMFGGVLAIALLGAIVARFRPAGMALVMSAAAAAQMVVGVVGVALGFGATGPIWPWDTIGATGFFVALWLASACLFSVAAREPRGPGEPR